MSLLSNCPVFFTLAETPLSVYCKIELNDEKLKAFVYAVKNKYWFQMFIDDLPIWGENRD